MHPLTGKYPHNKNLLVFQGAGINESRGAEELVYSMLFLDAADFHLLIIGGGDVYAETLKKLLIKISFQKKLLLSPKFLLLCLVILPERRNSDFPLTNLQF